MHIWRKRNWVTIYDRKGLPSLLLLRWVRRPDRGLNRSNPFYSKNRRYVRKHTFNENIFDFNARLPIYQIVQLAAKYHKTPAQIALRYQIDRGHIAIPKSSNKVRLSENIAIFDFKLNVDDLVALNKLNKNKRYFTNDV